ncbi:DUF6777 domain-containing protein [Streptomyces sp. NPDC088789]|uniref:DUF6777 domain-containing protein n=1 Tax=Streptomyces sp. NPDC088789 TaxID=3365899 RepID=UPI0038093C0C
MDGGPISNGGSPSSRRTTAPRRVRGGILAVCALAAALVAAGCAGGDGRRAAAEGGALLLEPAGTPGRDPFTVSTARAGGTPEPLTRMPRSARSSEPPRSSRTASAQATAALSGLRTLSGGTPGLYGGVQRVGSCDVERQIGHLTGDPAMNRAFAEVAGVAPAGVPDHLRALTPVVLRADTRVTNHGYRDGRVSGYQSVLQTGTPVLVDDRGVPRLRCDCGNPLTPPVAARDTRATSGEQWSGYRPARVVVVRPAPRAITHVTIINSLSDTWIERRIGTDVRHDKLVSPPQRAPERTEPGGELNVSDGRGDGHGDAHGEGRGDGHGHGLEEPGLAGHEVPGGPSTEDLFGEGFPDPFAEGPAEPSGEGEALAEDPFALSDEIGPDVVPELPDPIDGAGLIPDAPATPEVPEAPDPQEDPEAYPETDDGTDAGTDTETDAGTDDGTDPETAPEPDAHPDPSPPAFAG